MPETNRPNLFLIAGPNGAGKTSSARHFFSELIASGFYLDPDKVALDDGLSTVAAGRATLIKQQKLLENRSDFARETTASGKEPQKLLSDAKALGYKVTLIFVYIDEPELLQQRVAKRVKAGGHDIPLEAQIRRFSRSLDGGVALAKLADRVILIDNSSKRRRLLRDSAQTTGALFHLPRPYWVKQFNMPPITRLKTRPQFLKARNGPTERRKSLVIQARARKDQSLHIGEGFTATKKVGNAVIRNRAKRRLREAARQLLPKHGVPGADYVFIARLQTATIGWQRLLDDMESALISVADDLRGRTDGR